MATKLTKTIRRDTDSMVFSASKHRNIVISIEPSSKGAVIGLKLKGTRDIYRLGVSTVFVQAINNHEGKVERRAKQLVKDEKISRRAATARAKKELAGLLR